ncbi:MAG: TadE family protein [Verrucomicrobiota bacterium]
MKTRRHFQKRTRSQALVEFSLMATLFFTMILVTVQYAIWTYRAQVIVAAAREGANISARVTANNIESGLEAALAVATSAIRYTDFMTNGAIIVTKMQLYTNSFYLSGFTTANTVGSTGGLFGGTNENQNNSRLLTNSTWTTLPRTGPAIPSIMVSTNTVVAGKDLYCVEIFYTNRSPLRLIGDIKAPSLIYEKSFFMAP